MAQAYATRLRYLDASDLDDSAIDFDGLDVRGRNDEKLGDIDGFIVDPDSGRLHYAVVDSGGWFRSRRFLVPIGHASVDRDAGLLRVQQTRETLSTLPEFDESRFRGFSDDELREFEGRIGSGFWGDERAPATAVGSAYYQESRHYAQPEWWQTPSSVRERLRPIDTSSYLRAATSTARSSDAAPASRVVPVEEGGARREVREDRELITARERGEESPHFDGRAQPGDVLGLETGGERTGLGDTSEEENRRREAAERTNRDRDR
jgi:hypothetical protein